MFPWSAVFSLEPKVPGQRTSEELVTNTLMLELGAMVKRTERIRLEQAAEGRRRRRSSSSVADYTWLANPQNPQPYELTPNDMLELQGLCAKIPPAQCGPVIVRFRRLVSQMEPEVYEVPRLFRSVLRDCLEELTSGEEDDQMPHNTPIKQQRSKSLSFITFRTKFRTGYFFKGSGLRGSRGNLQQQVDWSDEEEDDDGEEEAIKARFRKGRSRSMPEITPLEQSAQG
ncbi:RD3 domain-containing protein [Dunckerocampus dactyliophorus]|uniref:RD3 domain-containing protein n=1 Tax=Dunckerocampus dactyliophorus TaxID=161453 RepID=UPI002406422D|nr:RD3 domain-containing protein [Dunckerocampus dactyliophorus]XP_054648141.1 RD3 domain-containing protein [Dunckerocampus dactyliophorus]